MQKLTRRKSVNTIGFALTAIARAKIVDPRYKFRSGCSRHFVQDHINARRSWSGMVMNVFIPNNAIVCIDAMSPREAFMFENMFATYAKSFF